tara:strand:+ start:626 stop:880 length:255 start_codon:yes stop_codon:yes gene_type:complete
MAGKTSEYYKKNPEARAKRLKQQKAYMQTEKGKEIRRNADRLSAKLGGSVGDGKDAAHYKGSKTKGRLQPESENRRSRLKVRKK